MHETSAGQGPVKCHVRPLIERLRAFVEMDGGDIADVEEAADEIERLCAEVAVLRMACDRWEAALKRSDEARRSAVDAERARWKSVCQEHAADREPEHKAHEGYAEGWLDACNEILWAGEKA